jgi:hypothetical protein
MAGTYLDGALDVLDVRTDERRRVGVRVGGGVGGHDEDEMRRVTKGS